MKKWKKLSLLTLALITLFTVSLSGAYAKTTPSSVTVKRSEVLSDTITNHEYGFTYFTTTDGDSLYCIDNQKLALRTGTVATLTDEADAGIKYILENGYPNKSKYMTNNTENDKIITQAAIWWYLDDTNQGDNKLSDEFRNATTTDVYKLIPKRIKPLVEAAKQAKKESAKTPTITVRHSKDVLTLSSDKKYYESETISAVLTNAKTYSVSLAGASKNTKVIAENGNAKNEFNSNEGFKVMIPASEIKDVNNVTVNFQATATNKTAKIFKSSDNNYQRVVGLFDDPKTIKTNIKLTPKETKHVCEVIDNTFYGKNGNVVDEKTYTKECGHVCEIVNNKFYGKNGNVVDEKTYTKECGHVCEIVNDKFYGKNGKVVSEKKFNEECKNVCKIVDNNYYGADGNIVDKATFDAECGTLVTAPSTSANVPPILIVMGLLLIAGGTGLIIYRSKKSYL